MLGVQPRYCATCGHVVPTLTARPPTASAGAPPDAIAMTPAASQSPPPHAPAAANDPELLARIRAAKETIDTKCLECGYEGLMPVVRRPWYTRPGFDWGGFFLLWLFVVGPASLFLGLGFVGGVVLGCLFGAGWVYVVRTAARKGVRFQCPACQQVLQFHG